MLSVKRYAIGNTAPGTGMHIRKKSCRTLYVTSGAYTAGFTTPHDLSKAQLGMEKSLGLRSLINSVRV